MLDKKGIAVEYFANDLADGCEPLDSLGLLSLAQNWHIHMAVFLKSGIWTTRKDNSLEVVQIFLAYTGVNLFVDTVPDTAEISGKQLIGQPVFNSLNDGLDASTKNSASTKDNSDDGTKKSVSTNDDSDDGTKNTVDHDLEVLEKDIIDTGLDLSTKKSVSTNDGSVNANDLSTKKTGSSKPTQSKGTKKTLKPKNNTKQTGKSTKGN